MGKTAARYNLRGSLGTRLAIVVTVQGSYLPITATTAGPSYTNPAQMDLSSHLSRVAKNIGLMGGHYGQVPLEFL